jgi:uncharacterized OB-fold protein
VELNKPTQRQYSLGHDVTTTESYRGFLPDDIPRWQMPFWDSLRSHQIRVQECSRCGTLRYHPKEACPKCQSRKAAWTRITGRGRIYTYTVVRRAPSKEYEPDIPYGLVHATMDEGIRMAAGTSGLDITELQIGLDVRIIYEDVTADWTFFRFTAS